MTTFAISDAAAAILASRPEIGTLCREGLVVFYVTTDLEGGVIVEAADPADLPSAEEVKRLRAVAEARRNMESIIGDASADLAHAADVYHLVTETLMAVVHTKPTGYRLGSLVAGRSLYLNDLATAEQSAARWNAQLTPEQIEARCSVRPMHRREALAALIDQARAIIAKLDAEA